MDLKGYKQDSSGAWILQTFEPGWGTKGLPERDTQEAIEYLGTINQVNYKNGPKPLRIIDPINNSSLWSIDWAGTLETVSAVDSSWVYNDGDELCPYGLNMVKHSQVEGLEGWIYKSLVTNLSALDTFGINVFVEPETGWVEQDWELHLYCDYPGMTNWWKYSGLKLGNRRIPGYWNKLILPKSLATIGGGSPSWSTIQGIGLKILTSAGTQCRHYWGPFYGFNNKAPKGAIILTFDDNLSSVYTEAYNYMVTKGYKGVSFVNGGYVSTGSSILGLPSVTVKQLKHMQQSGWDISNHGFNHLCLRFQSLAQQHADIGQGSKWLLDNGLIMGARFYAYPNYLPDQRSWQVVPSYASLARGGGSPFENFNVYPFHEPYNLASLEINETTTLPQWQSYLQKAVTNKLVLCFAFHNIGSTGTYGEVLQTNFRAFIDAIAAYDLDVLTFSDIVDGHWV